LNELPECIKWNRASFGRQLIFIENSGMDFVAVHIDGLWRFYAKTHLPSLGAQHDDPNVWPDGHGFSTAARQNQHSDFP
jgi:hypothetical protein